MQKESVSESEILERSNILPPTPQPHALPGVYWPVGLTVFRAKRAAQIRNGRIHIFRKKFKSKGVVASTSLCLCMMQWNALPCVFWYSERHSLNWNKSHTRVDPFLDATVNAVSPSVVVLVNDLHTVCYSLDEVFLRSRGGKFIKVPSNRDFPVIGQATAIPCNTNCSYPHYQTSSLLTFQNAVRLFQHFLTSVKYIVRLQACW